MADTPICPTREIKNEPDMMDAPWYRCPVCGKQLDGGDTVAEDINGYTVGCVYCIRYHEIWEKDINENNTKAN